MSIVKTIDVALRATTENFDDGLSRSAAHLNRFSATHNRVASDMGKAAKQFQSGAIGPQEYSRRIQAAERDLRALSAGFDGMRGAVARADAVMKKLETDTERYENEVAELNQLLKVGALSQDQHAQALRRTTEAYATTPFAKEVDNKVVGAITGFNTGIPIIDRFTNVLADMGPVGIAASAALVGVGVAVAGAATAFKILKDVVSAGLSRLEEASNAANKVGLLTGEFQKLEFAARFSNLSSETFVAGLQKMGKTVSEAATGNKTAIKTFDELGLNVSKLAGMTPDKAFLEVADAIAKIENPFHRVRLSMEVFGKSGGDMLNVMAGGSAKIQQFMSEAEKLRIPIGPEDAENVSRVNNAITSLKGAFEGLGNTITVFVAAPLAEVITDMTRMIAEPQKVISDVISKWREIGTAIATSTGPLELTNKLTSIYFDHVNHAAAVASNIPPPPKIQPFDTEAISEFSAFVDDARKRQHTMATGMVKDHKTLLDKQREAAESFLQVQKQIAGFQVRSQIDKTIPATLDIKVPTIPPVQPITIPFNYTTGVSDAEKARADMVKTFTKPLDVSVVTHLNVVRQLEAAHIAQNKLTAMTNKWVIEAGRASTQYVFQVQNATKLNSLLDEHIRRSTGVAPMPNIFSAATPAAAQYLNTLERISVVRIPKLEMPAVDRLRFSIEPPNIDALNALEQKIAEVKQKLSLGRINIEDAKSQIQAAQDAMEQLKDKHRQAVESMIEKEKDLQKTRLDTLKDLLKQQHDAFAKQHPGLAAIEEFRVKVAQINDLYAHQLIGLQKRNELIAFAGQQARAPAIEEANRKRDEFKSRADSIAQSVKNPFEKFVDTTAELQKLQRMGLITPEVARRAFSQAREELKGSLKEFEVKVQANPPALEAGTQAAFKAFHDNKAGLEQANEQKKTNQILSRLERRAIVLASTKRL